MAMENPDLIPVIVLRVNVACCKNCPGILRKALLKLDGVIKVDFNSEFKKVCIRSTLDPIMIIKEIAEMNKNAELIFYDKEPILDDQNPKNPKTSPREKQPRTEENGKEKNRCCPDDNYDDDSDYNCKKNVRGKGKREDEDHYSTRNVRENGHEKYNRCRNYDSPDENVRDNGREKHYRCGNYGHPQEQPSEDNYKVPKMFFDDGADIFKEYSRRRSGFWDESMRSRDNDRDQFRSKSCRFDGRNSQRWLGPEERNPYESFYENGHSSMRPPPPPFEQYGSSMPPRPPPPPPPTSLYHSDFGMGNPHGCILM